MSIAEKSSKQVGVNDGKYGDNQTATEGDSVDVVAPNLSSVPELDTEKGDQLPHQPILQRRLNSRHITFVGLGSGIGVGVFLGIGAALANAGPVGLVLAFVITGMVIWTVIQSIGEMATLLPVSGTFPHYVSRFVDPAMGLALGWNYWWNYAISTATELSAAALIISYWSDLNPAVWITVCFVPIIILNYLPVSFYGEAEVVTSSIKVITIVGLIILGLVIDLGGGPEGDRIGFRYWKNPGPFAQFPGVGGSLGQFLAFFTAFINAGYSYSGTEVVVVTAAEASNPTRQIPKATKRVIYRIILFNMGSALIISMLVPYTSPELLGDTGNAASSPWVIAINTAGIKVLPSIINAAILTSAWSAGNTFVYVSSRTLLGLAQGGQAPKIFLRCSKSGVPYYAVTLTLSMSLLAYLSAGSGGSSQAFTWLQNITSLAGILAWGVLCVAYIRMHRAMKVQGISRSSIPWKSAFQPYSAYFGAIISFIIVVFSGFSVFIKGNWSTSDFFANYISLGIFLVPWAVMRIWWRTSFVKSQDIDLWTGRLDSSEETPEKAPVTWYGKLLDKLF